MTQSLPLSEFKKQFDALCRNPEELMVTEGGEPIFSILPYDLYQSLLETLDVVADSEALASLQQNLLKLKAGSTLKLHEVAADGGQYPVGLTESAYQVLREQADAEAAGELKECFEQLSQDPESQGLSLVGSLKGYRSIRAEGGLYQIIYFMESKQVVVVYIQVASALPGTLLIH